jgi:hypothetical protein
MSFGVSSRSEYAIKQTLVSYNKMMQTRIEVELAYIGARTHFGR